MAAKVAGSGSRLFAVLFTGIVAPVVVEITVKALNEEGTPPVQRQSSSQEEERPRRDARNSVQSPPVRTDNVVWAPKERMPEEPAEITQVIVKGVGKTPQEALHDALRTALSQALASQVESAAWARHGQALFEDALRNNTGLILGWRELGTSRQWKLGGALHHMEVAVEINRQALRKRLRALHRVS